MRSLLFVSICAAALLAFNGQVEAAGCVTDVSCGVGAPCFNLTKGDNEPYSFTCNTTYSLKWNTHGPNMSRCNLDGSFIIRNTFSELTVRWLLATVFVLTLANFIIYVVKYFFGYNKNGLLESDPAGVYIFFYSICAWLEWFSRATPREYDRNSHNVPIVNHLEQSDCDYYGFALESAISYRVFLSWFLVAVVYSYKHFNDTYSNFINKTSDSEKAKLVDVQKFESRTFTRTKMIRNYGGAALGLGLVFIVLVLFVFNPAGIQRSCCERLITNSDFTFVINCILFAFGILAPIVETGHFFTGKVSVDTIVDQVIEKSWGPTWVKWNALRWWVKLATFGIFLEQWFFPVRLLCDAIAFHTRTHPHVFYQYKNWDWSVNGFWTDFVILSFLAPKAIMDFGRVLMPEYFVTAQFFGDLGIAGAHQGACERMGRHGSEVECQEILAALNQNYKVLTEDDLSAEEAVILPKYHEYLLHSAANAHARAKAQKKAQARLVAAASSASSASSSAAGGTFLVLAPQ